MGVPCRLRATCGVFGRGPTKKSAGNYAAATRNTPGPKTRGRRCPRTVPPVHWESRRPRADCARPGPPDVIWCLAAPGLQMFSVTIKGGVMFCSCHSPWKRVVILDSGGPCPVVDGRVGSGRGATCRHELRAGRLGRRPEAPRSARHQSRPEHRRGAPLGEDRRSGSGPGPEGTRLDLQRRPAGTAHPARRSATASSSTS